MLWFSDSNGSGNIYNVMLSIIMHFDRHLSVVGVELSTLQEHISIPGNYCVAFLDNSWCQHTLFDFSIRLIKLGYITFAFMAIL